MYQGVRGIIFLYIFALVNTPIYTIGLFMTVFPSIVKCKLSTLKPPSYVTFQSSVDSEGPPLPKKAYIRPFSYGTNFHSHSHPSTVSQPTLGRLHLSANY